MDAPLSCPPLVLIEWLDSGQPVPNWQWLEALEPRQPHICVSVGFLVGRRKRQGARSESRRQQWGKWLGPGLGRDHHPGRVGEADGLRVPLRRSFGFARHRLMADRLNPRDRRPPLDPCQISTKRLNQGVVCLPVAQPGGRRAANRAKEAGFRRVGAQAGATCGTSYKATAGAS